MNQTKTLSEICKSLNVTRKVIQGYEKHGLVKPCGKNKYGRLVYDSESIGRITKIRFYQNLGFSLKEISEISYTDKRMLMELLANKNKELEENIKDLKNKQTIIRNMINEKGGKLK